MKVEHKKVSTACFNVHTRVLTLPLWEKASNVVYDLLVAHECGHSIFTPDEDWLDKVKVPPQFVNVVEDARVEKLMKRKYAGLAKTFFNGYKELNEEDFFQISEEDISTFNLADRANLYFKIGNYANIPIEDGEEKISFKSYIDENNYVFSQYKVEDNEKKFSVKIVENGVTLSESKIKVELEDGETMIALEESINDKKRMMHAIFKEL